MNNNVLQETSKNAIVVVLGDIGRSPRMCYHALSLATHGFEVDLVGYADTKPHEKIVANPRIRLVNVFKPPHFSLFIFSPLMLVAKLLWLFIMASYTLIFKTNSSATLLLVQNPPGIPTLLICCVAAWLKGATFNIDWHNYTFSVLEPSRKTPNIPDSTTVIGRIRKRIYSCLIGFANRWEGFFGRQAHWNLCVSQAMRKDMQSRWGLQALTLYDKAPAWIFRPMSMEERHYFIIKLFSNPSFQPAVKSLENYARTFSINSEEIFDPSETSIISRRDPLTGEVECLSSRPMLLVSSTSWSPDEDFGILFEALKEYERFAHSTVDGESAVELPNLLVIITGKGLLREHYADKFAKFHGPKVQVVLAWLSAEDYPKILACADLGISLHTSTSGLDLPMKVVDMFGCHLPVLAKRFEAIGELVADGLTGALFDTSSDLKRILVELSVGFPTSNDKLKKLKQYFGSHLQAQSWEDQWDATFWPLVQENLRYRAEPTKQQKRWERYTATASGDKQN